jgi:hypothetical protein
LNAIFFLEASDERGIVVGRRVGIEGERAFALGAVDEPLLAIGALIIGDLSGATGLRGGGRRCERDGGETKRCA